MFLTTLLTLMAAIIFVNSQPLEITLDDCDINKEAVVGLLQAVGDRRLSLTIRDEYMYVIILIVLYILCLAIIALFVI